MTNATEATLPQKQQLTAKLASARQSLMLLKSQIKAGEVENSYWSNRLDGLNQLLEELVKERVETDQKQRLAALYEVSRALGSSLELDEVLNQVMDAIIQLTSAERGFLMLFDEGGKLQVKAARNVAKETLAEEEFAFSRGVIRMVAETGEQVVTTNAQEDPRFADQASVVANDLRSIQCVPLHARGDVIGVIYVDNTIHTGVFDEADLEMLSTFASQAAVAIENARLFTLTDQALAARVEELSVMQEIDQQLNATLDFKRVMALTLDWAMNASHADNGAIGVRNWETDEIEPVAKQGKKPQSAVKLLTESAKKNGSSIAVQIEREGRVVGVIALVRENDSDFPPVTKEFVQRLADHAAIAIENAQLYEAVRRANDAKTEFVSIVTHELRLPMTAIKGYTDMVLLSDDASEQHKGFLQVVRNNVDRMSVLVSDLSDISRIESGRLNIEVEEDVDLRETLDHVIEGMQTEIDRREHHIEIDMPEEAATVQVDPRRLQQILTNLISNAYKYTPDGGTITIRAYALEDMVVCDVEDTGIGMTQEEVEHLFVKFWRAEDRHVREQPGTGLGLAIAKNLVEMHGGEMSVSSNKDVGTVFSFTLPAGT